jgi:hypothetical protein
MSVSKIQTIALEAADAGTFEKKIQAFIAQARMLADGGLTLEELGQLLFAFTQLGVYAAEDLADATGEEKKQYVLEAVGYLYDVIAPAVPLPWFLAPFRRFLRDPVRAIVLAVVSGAVEVIVASMPAAARSTAAVHAKLQQRQKAVAADIASPTVT